jgi:hypothetical protein
LPFLVANICVCESGCSKQVTSMTVESVLVAVKSIVPASEQSVGMLCITGAGPALATVHWTRTSAVPCHVLV